MSQISVTYFLDVNLYHLCLIYQIGIQIMPLLFYECKSLLSLPDISKWNINNVTNINYLFFRCESLSSLPDISKWNVYNIREINYLFYNCISLSYLPDISKWNLNNALSTLPDISTWNLNNVINIKSINNLSISLLYNSLISKFKKYWSNN